MSTSEGKMFRVRLRVRMSKAFTTQDTKRSVVVDGRSVEIVSQEPNQPLAGSTWIVLRSGGFATEADAETFGRKLVEAVEFAGLCCRLGIDVGDDQPTAWVNEEFARSTGLIAPDERLKANVHGLMVLPDDEKTRIPSVKADAVVTADPRQFEQALAQLGAQMPLHLSTAANGARLLNLALINPQPLGQIVLALSAVEELGQNEEWSAAQRSLIEALADTATGATDLTEEERKEVADAFRRGAHRVSLRQGVMRILDKLDLKHLRKEWDRVYALRSGIFHGTAHLSEPDTAQLANDALALCGRIVLALAEFEGVKLPEITATHFPMRQGNGV